MRVACQILQDPIRSTEGTLGIDNPVLPDGLVQKALEGCWIFQQLQATVEFEVATSKRLFQRVDEFSAKHTAEDLDIDQERPFAASAAPAVNPA